MKKKASGSPKRFSDEAMRLRFKRAAEGDQDSFWALIEPYGGLIYSVAFGIMKDSERAQGILHEVYIAAFHSLDNLRNPGRLGAWLYTITRNLCYDILRKEKRIREKKGDYYRSRPRVIPINEVLVQKEEFRLLGEAVLTLPEHFRVVLGLKYMNQYSCRDISEVLNISIEAVKSRLFEARKLLRRRMEKFEGTSESVFNGGVEK